MELGALKMGEVGAWACPAGSEQGEILVDVAREELEEAKAAAEVLVQGDRDR